MNTYYSPFNLKLHVIDLICLIPDFHYKFGLIIIIMIYWWYYGNWRRQLLLTQPAWCLIHSKYVVLMTKILTWNILSNGRDKAFPVVSKPDLKIPWVWIFFDLPICIMNSEHDVSEFLWRGHLHYGYVQYKKAGCLQAEFTCLLGKLPREGNSLSGQEWLA